MKKITILLIILTCFFKTAYSISYHAALNGKDSNMGTLDSPWTLQKALGNTQKIKAGDTLFVHGGIYTGAFTSTLKGSANSPVIVKPYDNEKVVIDGNVNVDVLGVLTFSGSYTWIFDLNIINSNGNRVGNPPNTMDYKDGVYFIGPNNKLINCIICNNGGNGIGFWKPALDSEIYGCIIYHNGYIGSDRGHGHGVYMQNETGTKHITDNIFFNSFGIGIQAYSESGQIKGYEIEGNIFFDAGLPGADYLERHIIIGGMQTADRAYVTSNYFYNRPNYSSKAGVQFGYSVANQKAEFNNNYMVNGSFYVIKNWNSVKCKNNALISESADIQLIGFDNFFNISMPEFNNNQYYKGNLGLLTFANWKKQTGQDAASTYSASTPAQTKYFIEKNDYEEGRANIVIFNWEKKTSVGVNLSGVLKNGEKYVIYDVSRLSKGPILKGRFTGNNVNIPMNFKNEPVDLPYGNIIKKSVFKHLNPDYGVYVVQKGYFPDSDLSAIESFDYNNDNDFDVYLTPNNSECKIAITAKTNHKSQITIINNLGQKFFDSTFETLVGKNNFTADISRCPNGIYLVNIVGAGKVFTQKIIKGR